MMPNHIDPGDQTANRTWKRPKAPPVPTSDAPGLFDPVLATPTREIRGMVRGNDPVTSQRAAVDMLPKLSKLEARIMTILATQGPEYSPEGLTDRELETLREFARYGPSTVRRRRTTLFQRGLAVDNGVRDKLTVWRVADPKPEHP